MASITGITAPTPVQENTTGSPITISNVQKDDFFIVIASSGGTLERANISQSGITTEQLADLTATPSYTRWVTDYCYYYWYPYYWWYYPYYYYWYHYWWWYWYYGYPYYRCVQRQESAVAMTRVLWVRARENGSITFSATANNSSVSRFTVYHFRVQTQADAGKVIESVSWVARTPQAQGGGSVWSQRANTNDFMLVLAVGKSGGTISATPSGGIPTNLVNYQFTHGSNVRTLVRLDWITSADKVQYTYTNADVSQALIGYSVDIRERYANFPTTGAVYWVAVPVQVKSSLQRVMPKALEQLIAQSSTLDPTGFGLEATFTKGNIQTTEDDSGHISVSSYDELHIYRFPQSITVDQSVGDILLTDAELEAYIEAQKRGWVA